MMGSVISNGCQVEWDGKTVWLNGSDGMCWARFGKGGIDIHNSIAEQIKGNVCLHCTHTKPGTAEWVTFVIECLAYYRVTIPPRAKPHWIDDQALAA